ncbi:MAG TPA: FAD binding domain-containing protein [Candidatus Ornithospirochaeta stercorigallinarum]|nr:FAD binding domain-containing protein [Candidatus Ornithospirochaeta stercorigallinarum]
MRELVRVDSLMDAVGRDGLFLSGGTEILRLNTGVDKNSPLIDILPLLSDEIRKEGDSVLIGASATFALLLSSPVVPDYLKEALCYMPSPQLRNQATIGGNIASWRDDSFLIPTLSASGAELTVVSSDGEKERMSIKDYGLKRGLILSVSIPASAEVRNFRESLTSHSHAVVTASFGEGECYAVKGSGIFFSYDELKFNDDMFGSASYKSYLATLYRKESGRV